MKNVFVLLATIVGTLAFASSSRAVKRNTPCEAQRVVEMRNAVMAAHLLCKTVVTGEMYDAFVIKNRKRIKQANDVAVQWHLKKYKSRKHFDALDSEVMNSISMVSSQNPGYFCERMKEFAPLVQTLSVDELLKKQTQIELPVCK